MRAIARTTWQNWLLVIALAAAAVVIAHLTGFSLGVRWIGGAA